MSAELGQFYRMGRSVCLIAPTQDSSKMTRYALAGTIESIPGREREVLR